MSLLGFLCCRKVLHCIRGDVLFEVKCARINIANRSRGGMAENRAFQGLLTSPGKCDKEYDVLIAITCGNLGLRSIATGALCRLLISTFN